jgi:hypothetical protein
VRARAGPSTLASQRSAYFLPHRPSRLSAIPQLINIVMSTDFSSSSSSLSSFPPEVFYRLVKHTSPSATSSLCLVSSSVRKIASPQLYQKMIITSPTQLAPFLSNATSLDQSLTLDKVITLDLTVQCAWFENREAQARQTYEPISIPHLKHLSILFARNRHPSAPAGPFPDGSDRSIPWSHYSLPMDLASDMLAHFDPHSLTLSHRYPYPSVDPFDIDPTVFHKATSTWTKLKSLSFIDTVGFWVGFGNDDDVPLAPSHLPESCLSSIALAWSFTERVGGYAAVSESFCNGGGVLLCLATELGIFGWPSVQTLGIDLDVGDREADRAELRKHLGKLPEEQRRLVRF